MKFDNQESLKAASFQKVSWKVPEKHRSQGKLKLVNFVNEIVNLTAARQIAKVSKDWFEEFEI